MKDRKYLIRWSTKDADGKTVRHNKIVNGDSIEAEAELGRMLRPVAEAAKPVERTFASYADGEWAQYVADHWKSSTQLTQGSFVTKHIRPYFDGMNLTAIRPEHIVAFHKALADHLSKKTRRNVHAVLSTMFANALELELIPKSPIKRKQAPQLEDHEKQMLTREQGWALWDALAGADTMPYRAFYGVLLFTGIRGGEALGLKWEDLDFASREINIRRAISRGREATPKTRASIRRKKMSGELYTALLNHKAMSKFTSPADYVFACSTGRVLNVDMLRERLQAVLRDKLNIHLPPREDGLHLLRHSSGSWVYEGKGLKEAQQWLGHASHVVTGKTYVHLAPGWEQATVEDVFSRPPAVTVAPERTN